MSYGQKKTKPQELLEFKMIKQMQTFSFSPSINLVEKGKWLLEVSSFEATNSVFSITNENNAFSISIPGYWSSRGGAETIHKLKKLLELRSQNDIELHVQEFNKRGNKTKIGHKKYKSSDIVTQKKWDNWRDKKRRI